jgi:hypothetical protein
MTTTKPTTDKTTKATTEALTDEELRTAHELHALTHALYGHITITHPWAAPMTPFAGFDTATPGNWTTPGFPSSPTW